MCDFYVSRHSSCRQCAMLQMVSSRVRLYCGSIRNRNWSASIQSDVDTRLESAIRAKQQASAKPLSSIPAMCTISTEGPENSERREWKSSSEQVTVTIRRQNPSLSVIGMFQQLKSFSYE